ncbi:fungal-specific transcription factor domain-containing protein [Xylaria bambusicola]|uniref:fungal-specific transcription factor domain-containing protein n=1 Tax=Xylaria bambusicola TaxID=326684 RepID=UPI0020081CC5|nr:fungal-specific transcription factor domain-containing protein [Xylaria bambusicola]KAI0513148.1 fungal-specific transcription factor domain-containing protein [Xylaria bambusicola]
MDDPSHTTSALPAYRSLLSVQSAYYRCFPHTAHASVNVQQQQQQQLPTYIGAPVLPRSAPGTRKGPVSEASGVPSRAAWPLARPDDLRELTRRGLPTTTIVPKMHSLRDGGAESPPQTSTAAAGDDGVEAGTEHPISNYGCSRQRPRRSLAHAQADPIHQQSGSAAHQTPENQCCMPDLSKDSATRGPGSGLDGAQADHNGETDDYFDADVDHESDSRQFKDGRNGVRASENVDGASVVSSRTSDTPQDYATPALPMKSESIDWEDVHSQKSQTTPRHETLATRTPNPRQSSFSTDDGRSPNSRSPILHHNDSGHRVPYFRYFGPTAILPGFKQMVVKIRGRRRSSMSATSPSTTTSIHAGLLSTTQPDLDLGHIEDIPFYDINDPNPVHPLILNLVETFFLRLGSNYPFLTRHKFPLLVKEKRVEPILVDAVCALAARFSDISLFKRWNDGKLVKSEYGQAYAQRAKAATVDSFACPSVAAVQACLLMAYDGFGADQDSALWMYLGIAIRMAVDLGLPREDGVKYHGPEDPWYARLHERPTESFVEGGRQDGEERTLTQVEQKEIEQERIDTFWAVFFLDRAISSGTGRPVTLRDDDFDLSLPKASLSPSSGWPNPYAALLHIIHLYGRPKDLTKDKLHRLVRMDPRLRFDANNFQAHVKNGNGTTFILLHFWFHALIIVLHQPTLLTSQGAIDRKHQLKAHSRELSMSSAKTIADILAFAELLDPRCFIGNPFTSQPIYIAACAFLLESKANSSNPDSRNTSPQPVHKNLVPKTVDQTNGPSKHLLLASAALQNYQLCYKALKQMHAYWGGVRYILNVLDQKSHGEWDCETFTTEEYESTKRIRKDNLSQKFAKKNEFPSSPLPENGPPLAWSLTGTTNSPNSSLTLLFQSPINATVAPNHQTQQHQMLQSQQQNSAPATAPTPPGNMIYDPIRQSLPEPSLYPPAYPQPNTSALRDSVRVTSSTPRNHSQLRYESLNQDGATKIPQDTKLAINSVGPQGPAGTTTGPYTSNGPPTSSYESQGYLPGASPQNTQSPTQPFGGSNNQAILVNAAFTGDSGPSTFASSGSGLAASGYYGAPGSDLHLLTYDNETDIGQHLTSFEHTEMMSWFGDYFPSDVFGLYTGESSMG